MYRLKEIATIINGTLINGSDIAITYLSIDTRKLSNPEQSLFFAIPTTNNDGHHYIKSALKQNVAAVVCNVATDTNKPQIVVENTLVALQTLAKHHRDRFDIPIVAITGSNGKTITKEWASALLINQFNICRSPKSYNSQIGVPLSLWNLSTRNTLGVFEAGISEPEEMVALEKMISPTIGVITNIGNAHEKNFNNQTHILNEKIKLFENSKVVIAPHNELIISKLKSKKHDIFTHGNNKDANLELVSHIKNNITLSYQNQTRTVETQLSDIGSVQNILSAVSIGLVLGMTFDQLVDKIHVLQPVDMRLQQAAGINNNQLILDYYNSDFESLQIALQFLNQQSHHSNKTAIISDILQSKQDDISLYININNSLINSSISKVVGIGPKLLHNQRLFSNIESYFYRSIEDFIQQHPVYIHKDETILFKGARSFQFEKIASIFKKKTHHTRLEVNLNNIAKNLTILKSNLKPKTKVMAMVKALSYGSGGFQVAKVLEFNNVDYLGVAYTDEAVSLRSAGIQTPIMILNPDLSNTAQYEELNVEPVISSLTALEKVKNSKLNIHLEIDTGMHRLGFDKSQIPLLLEALSNTNCKILSIYSHLAVADDSTQDSRTLNQIEQFKNIATTIKEKLPNNPLSHIANTSGSQRFKDAEMDMVRLGIGLYGVSPNKRTLELIPATIFKSYISQIRTIKPGEGVGYGLLDAEDKERKIAVVAVGYSDGYDRRFSRGVGFFLINGKRAKIVGNVCMDMTMCDVTDIPCEERQDVIIFGEEPTVQSLADSIGTIPYEILTNVSERVARIYYQK